MNEILRKGKIARGLLDLRCEICDGMLCAKPGFTEGAVRMLGVEVLLELDRDDLECGNCLRRERQAKQRAKYSRPG